MIGTFKTADADDDATDADDDTVGALAIDGNQGTAWGWAVGEATEADAQRAAVDECGQGCTSVLTFRDGCAAYAADQEPGSSAYGWASSDATQLDVTKAALDECASQGERTVSFESGLAVMDAEGAPRAAGRNRLLPATWPTQAATIHRSVRSPSVPPRARYGAWPPDTAPTPKPKASRSRNVALAAKSSSLSRTAVWPMPRIMRREARSAVGPPGTTSVPRPSRTHLTSAHSEAERTVRSLPGIVVEKIPM